MTAADGVVRAADAELESVHIRAAAQVAGARDLEGDLVIAPGGSLGLTCRLSIPPGGKIVVQPGGHLWLDGARLHNACGKTWQGIFTEEKNGVRGEVHILRQPSLQNTPDTEKKRAPDKN